MPFIRFNGWGLSDFNNFIANLGNTCAYGGYADSNATEKDPIFEQSKKGEEPSKEHIEDLVMAELSYQDERFARTTLQEANEIATCMIASTLELAKHMTHKSVCVIFGRDMYPMQEAIRVLEHKLRGTWIYVEGASRGICYKEKFLKGLARQFSKLFEKADVIYAVDTGYTGSVPDHAICCNHFFSESIRQKTQIRLVCYNRPNQEGRHLFINHITDKPVAYFRSTLGKIESFAKPVMRPIELRHDNLPILRISNKLSILLSMMLMHKVREEAQKILPYFSLYMDPEVDIATEFFGEKNLYPEDSEGPNMVQYFKECHATSDEIAVMELFPEKLKPTCSCAICQNPWDDYMKQKLKELS